MSSNTATFWKYEGKLVGKEEGGKLILYTCDKCPCTKCPVLRDALYLYKKTPYGVFQCGSDCEAVDDCEDVAGTTETCETICTYSYEVKIQAVKGVYDAESGEYKFELPEKEKDEYGEWSWISESYDDCTPRDYKISYTTAECEHIPAVDEPNCVLAVNWTYPKTDGGQGDITCDVFGNFGMTVDKGIYGPYVDISIGLSSGSDCTGYVDYDCMKSTAIVHATVYGYDRSKNSWESRSHNPTIITREGGKYIFRMPTEIAEGLVDHFIDIQVFPRADEEEKKDTWQILKTPEEKKVTTGFYGTVTTADEIEVTLIAPKNQEETM